jgi:hypothetical protein
VPGPTPTKKGTTIPTAVMPASSGATRRIRALLPGE